MLETSSKPWADKLLQTMPSGVLVLSEQLRASRANPAFAEIFDIDPSEVPGRRLDELVAVEGLEEHALDVLRSGKAREAIAAQWQPEDREARCLEVSIYPTSSGGDEALLLLVEDITEREQLRTRAKLSERGFREVIEHSPDGIAVHRDERFLYINSSFLNLFGVEHADELIGTPVYKFVHPEERPVLRERVQRMLDHAEKVPVRETRLLRRDGAVWTADLTARRVIFDGEPAIVSIARDITEQKQLTAQMMQMDRMIAAGTLAAGVGHEINNPLTYVSANLDFARERLSKVEAFISRLEAGLIEQLGPEITAELLDTRHKRPSLQDELRTIEDALTDAREGSGRIRDIVSQLRTFSPGDESAYKSLGIKKVIESARRMVTNEIRHRAKLVMELDETIRIFGNESKLGQVFLNLLINAAHAIEEGSYKDNEIRVRTSIDGECALVEVSDTGAGIDADKLPQIFDPFFTTKAVGQGTGLGLYICQRIIESHQGRIEVESEPGRGTTFRVWLPIAKAADKQHDTDEPLEASSPRRAQVLIIDDEPLIGRSIARSLGAEHDVTAVTSAADALEQLENGASFDLILCDVMMPDITGMDFHQRVAERFPEALETIVFITGGAFTPRALDFLEQTANPCLEKPIDIDKLFELVRERIE